MKEFKAGDKIKVKEKFWKIEIGVDVSIHFDMKKLVGRTLEVESVYDDGDVNTKQDDSKDDTEWSWNEKWLELYNPIITWETLKWKDVLVDYDGRERMVLGVLNDLVDVSCTDNFKMAYTNFHKQELQNDGYTIKQDTPKDLEETIIVGGYTYKLVK